ncbi:hypothetical protein LguiB_019282 [Lonicera macranthoides]
MTSLGTTSQSARFKGKKRKVSGGDDIDDDMIKVIQSVAEAIKEGNSILEKSQPYVYSEQELWNDLEALELPSTVLMDACLLLIENPVKKRAFFGCPFEGRKNLLGRRYANLHHFSTYVFSLGIDIAAALLPSLQKPCTSEAHLYESEGNVQPYDRVSMPIYLVGGKFHPSNFGKQEDARGTDPKRTSQMPKLWLHCNPSA